MCVNHEQGKYDETPMNKGIDTHWPQMPNTNRIVTFGYIRVTSGRLLKPSKRLCVTLRKYEGWIDAFRGTIQPFFCAG